MKNVSVPLILLSQYLLQRVSIFYVCSFYVFILWLSLMHQLCSQHWFKLWSAAYKSKVLPWKKCYPITDEFIYHATVFHWSRITHICVGKLTTIGSDNGLSPGRRQAIIWTNARILFIIFLGVNFSEILIEIHTFAFMKMHLKMSSGKRRPFCIGFNVLYGRPMSLTFAVYR